MIDLDRTMTETSFRKGSRVHSGYGAWVDTQRTGIVLDSPGEMAVLVKWDDSKHYGLETLNGLRHAQEPCAECAGVRTHKSSCRIWIAAPHEGHPYVSNGFGERPNCQACGRGREHRIHRGTE